MSMRSLISALMIALSLWLSSCGNQQSEIEAKLTDAWGKIHTIQQRTNADNPEVSRMLDNSTRRLKQAKDHLSEAEFFEAQAIADDVLFQLDNFLRFGQASVAPSSKGNLEFDGRVEFKAMGSSEWQRLDEDVRLEEVSAIKAAPRSQLRFKLVDGSEFIVEADSELKILSYNAGKAALALELLHGDIAISKQGEKGHLQLKQGAYTFVAEDDVTMELAFKDVNQSGYACVYDGQLNYSGSSEGLLNRFDALSWGANGSERVSLPPQVRIENPTNHDTVQIQVGQEANVDFRWYTQLEHSSFQLQVSEDSHFATRVYDNRLIRDSFQDVRLKEGEYSWRVRGFVEDQAGNKIPASFTKSMALYVSASGIVTKPENVVNDKEPAQGAKKPDLKNVRFQTIGDTIIVTGRTNSGMRVKANGTSAIVNEDGSFRAIIDLEPGMRIVRMVITDPLSGARTIEEKPLK